MVDIGTEATANRPAMQELFGKEIRTGNDTGDSF